ncbi:LysR family transcriptional regulator [Vibrio rumoiensis]|uniref:LysR family transcriptional regulator n=1 Tax=Vibrio rumoiensis 1S-45 TaxID=1188252 RepID=A0A1E5DZH7_9VIBR|nr:LysR family transcriptional regulator [Vibrio rumoiensis]OEF23409.1 LysR family transcriptional regulator [Vibrio rumoiensis 1S-45]
MLLEDLQVILKVAEFRSITAAATHLNMRTATASAAVKRVEAFLGAELFVRTTRQLRLSNAGERYIPQCEEAMQMLAHAKQNMQHDLGKIEGELRISVSSDLGRNVIIPWIDEFMDVHPGLSLKAHISDSNVDFYRDSVDMAVRYGSPTDANLYGFKICDIPRALCATPDYLEKHGTPTHPNDLVNHNGLHYQLSDMVHDTWHFTNETNEYKVKLRSNRTANDSDLVRRWCVKGYGFSAKSILDMSEDLLTGKVVTVMPEYQLTPTEIWFVCPSRQSITPAMRLLRDHFRTKVEQRLKHLKEENMFRV